MVNALVWISVLIFGSSIMLIIYQSVAHTYSVSINKFKESILGRQ